MVEKNYWYQNYSLEGDPSSALEPLLTPIARQRFMESIDIGCGKGRNLPVLIARSARVVALDYNATAIHSVHAAFPDVEIKVVNLLDENYFDHDRYNLGISWRVLHIGTDDERAMALDKVITAMKTNSYLAIAVSARGCLSFQRKLAEGATELCTGTISRITSMGVLNVRHYYTAEEIKNLDQRLRLEKILDFDEIAAFNLEDRGVAVVGSTGSGKTTFLSNLFNTKVNMSILTDDWCFYSPATNVCRSADRVFSRFVHPNQKEYFHLETIFANEVIDFCSLETMLFLKAGEKVIEILTPEKAAGYVINSTYAADFEDTLKQQKQKWAEALKNKKLYQFDRSKAENNIKPYQELLEVFS